MMTDDQRSLENVGAHGLRRFRRQETMLRSVLELGVIPAGAEVLDAPCGLGALSAALTRAGFRVWGADVSPVAQADLGERLRLVDLNGPLPWPEASFDAVFCNDGIEHLENHFLFVREAGRVLRPGGTLVITAPNVLCVRSRVRYLGSGFFHKDPRPLRESARLAKHHIALRTFPEYRYALHTSGFRLVHVSHTHFKPVNFLYAPFVPWMWLYTRIAFRKERDPVQRRDNREIRRALFSTSLLFGECLLLVAKKA